MILKTCQFGVACKTPKDDKLPPHDYSLKDRRHDPLVGVALWTVRKFTNQVSPIGAETAIISLSDEGCLSHLKRVFDGVESDRPRQAFFTRASANMLSTYTSMALHNHGPCFSLSGGSEAVILAFKLAEQLIKSEMCSQAILLSADYTISEYWSSAVLVNRVVVEQYEYWDSTNNQIGHSPSQCLHEFLTDL